MNRLLTELLKMIPSDTEERVERTKNRLNQPLREALRQEMGLLLNRYDADVEAVGRSAVRESASVRVRLVPGYPVSFHDRTFTDKHRLPALLGPWLPTLMQARDSLHHLSRDVIPWLQLDPEGEELTENDEAVTLLEASDFIERLIRVAQRVSVAKWILEVDEDILGVYWWTQPTWRSIQRGQPDDDSRDGHVELYWGVIGIVARVINVPIEDLTAVVLAHELAHAYSHLGTDIDGRRWRTDRFAVGDRELVEGLAQHYALAACRRIARFAPGCEKAYRALLPHQPSPYRVQEAWEQSFSKEAIRLALIETRRTGQHTLANFVDAMKRANLQLGLTR
jgi:hypothetical protein